ncbi:hypothetical protein ILUMI_06131 [Ignelater luminosus]|uniref:PiggyBac transposable element-derived protein domain-containing protein n=1 Tax=Ignelater luminosus TaxID=2038154 RepID=A0A8K0DG85_IGNLU|nr:hypothetical protein ILUMI_06131 [Ignelater luminosus]
MFLVFKQRPLRNEEIQQLADTFCADLKSDVEPYEDTGSEYLESEHSSTESDLEPLKKLRILGKKNRQFPTGTDAKKMTHFKIFLPSTNKHDLVGWNDVDDQFVHRMKIPDGKACIILADLNRKPRRLEILEQATNRKEKRTDAHEIMILRLGSKFYYEPKKPDDCKLYYMEDVVACLKKTYAQVRSESSHQSIDESMAKFKASTVRESDVSFCFDRLLDTLPFAAVVTCTSTRKNMPQFEKRKRKRGEYESIHNNNGTIGYPWMKTKEVMVLSNCHGNESVEISRTGKDGTKIKLSCLEVIQFYNSHMGDADLSDQLTGLYKVDRISMKWQKKVFYKLLLTTVVNAWIICKELENKPNMPFLNFLANLSGLLVSTGRQNTSVIRKRAYGR